MTQSELNKIYNKYSTQLYYYALGFTSCKETSQEIVQDAFVKLWQQNVNVINKNSFLRSIIKNACINYIRDKKITDKKEKEYINTDKTVEELRDELREYAEKIKRIMNTLPPKSKEIFIRKYLYGLKYKEIAEDLNISVNTVKSQLKYAGDKIKNKLNISDKTLLFILLIFFDIK